MRLGESLVYGHAPNSSHPVSPVPITGAFCFWTKEMQIYHSVGDSRCICGLEFEELGFIKYFGVIKS